MIFKITGDAIDVEIDDGLLAFRAEEEVTVGVVVHEEVFGEDGGADGVAEEVEGGFLVGVGVGVVGAEALAGEVGLGGGVEGGSEGIGPGVSTGGVGAPAGGIVPAVAPAGGVAVDGDEEDVVFAQLAAPLVHAAAALGQGDVRFLRHQERGVEAEGEEAVHDAGGDEAVPGVFPDHSVGRALARRLDAVAVVDEDFHGWSCVWVSTPKLHKISEKSNADHLHVDMMNRKSEEGIEHISRLDTE